MTSRPMTLPPAASAASPSRPPDRPAYPWEASPLPSSVPAPIQSVYSLHNMVALVPFQLKSASHINTRELAMTALGLAHG